MFQEAGARIVHQSVVFFNCGAAMSCERAGRRCDGCRLRLDGGSPNIRQDMSCRTAWGSLDIEVVVALWLLAADVGPLWVILLDLTRVA